MTLDYTKMFLIVTEEAVVKGHFTCMHKRQFVTIHCWLFYISSRFVPADIGGDFLSVCTDWQLVTIHYWLSSISSRFIPADTSRIFYFLLVRIVL